VWLEGLGKLKKIHLIWTRNHDLAAFSLVPQARTLQRAPLHKPAEGNFDIKYPKHRLDNIKMDTRKIRNEKVQWIQLAHDRV
jgi:hypothetical protein